MVIARYCTSQVARLLFFTFHNSILSTKVRGYMRNVVKDVKDVPVLTPLVSVCPEARFTDYSASK